MTNTTSSNTASTTALLAVDDLAIHVGGRALLQGISFRLHAGEALSLVGESGAGKSLLACLARMGDAQLFAACAAGQWFHHD